MHCGASNDHHRSLCPTKFPKRTNIEHVQLRQEVSENENNCDHTEEKMLISSGESVIMKTAVAEIANPYESSCHKVDYFLTVVHKGPTLLKT